MIGQDPERLIVSYGAGVRHPEVSGLEHLNLLQIRSGLADLAPQLTKAQRQRLRQADRELLERASEFLHAIQQIADLESWRTQESVPPTHWWWYLDVVVNLPAPIMSQTTRERMVEAAVA